MSLKFSTIPQKRLLQGITSASSTFYVNNILSFDGVNDVTPADLGTQHYVAFRNDTGTLLELMEIDPATISTGPITIVRRGLSFYGDLTTEDADLKLDWPSNSIVMFGTDVPQIFQWLKEYIDAAAIAGSVPASTSAAGIVVEGSQAEVDAGTATKTISAVAYKLFAPLNKRRGKLINDAVTATSGSDAYAIAPSPAITAYATYQRFSFIADVANTGACTLNVNGLGAKTIKKNVSVDLETGDILAGQVVEVEYDGTYMQMLSLSSLVYTNNTSANSRALYTVGVLDNALVKTYFNIQLLFNLWTGAIVNDTTTTFVNWKRSGTSANVYPGGAMATFESTSSAYLSLTTFLLNTSASLKWSSSKIVIFDWWGYLAASSTGSINMGISTEFAGLNVAYNDNTSVQARACFSVSPAGTLYATLASLGVGITNTDISSGITLNSWNNYRMEITFGTDVKFYINGVLKATLSGANLYTGSGEVSFGYGRSNSADFTVTAPNLSLQMN